VAKVVGAATVSEAYELKPLLEDSSVAPALKVINSGTIDRYDNLWGRKAMRYLGESYLQPVVSSDLKTKLPSKRRQQAEQPKIVVAGMTKVLECVADLDGDVLAAKSTSVIIPLSLCLEYLLGLMNSRLINYYYQSVFGGNKLQGGYLRIGPPQLKSVPIRTIDFDDPTDKAYLDQMVALGESMLDLHKQQPKTPQAKTSLKRHIEATDQEIDRLVYKLYDLTEDEIKIVEGR